ncbi:MAG: WG repeat-containing protein [Muribaculaceae bacterium]|nr:WG repeat-containing protein [Muribaculaceae bacterium]
MAKSLGTALTPRKDKSGKWGYVDKDGRPVIRAIFDNARDFIGDVAFVLSGCNYGMIDRNGSFIIEPKFEEIVTLRGVKRSGFRIVSYTLQDIFAAKLNDKYGLVNNLGNWVVEPIFDEVGIDESDLIKVWKDGLAGYLDTSGKCVIDPVYSMIAAWSDGRAAFSKPGSAKIGFIDLKGNEIIPALYDDADDFEDGYARVVDGGKEGYIDTAGKWYGTKP